MQNQPCLYLFCILARPVLILGALGAFRKYVAEKGQESPFRGISEGADSVGADLEYGLRTGEGEILTFCQTGLLILEGRLRPRAKEP